ncbi:hypothetical protein GCK32_021110 [Trichostrongylus colubriformis]|uniref:Uncharacterized protein n=1 Tax=Trichostrongylus colubriformis TaxID=6319 RepID=A0AAN8FRP2_TRICO
MTFNTFVFTKSLQEQQNYRAKSSPHSSRPPVE